MLDHAHFAMPVIRTVVVLTGGYVYRLALKDLQDPLDLLVLLDLLVQVVKQDLQEHQALLDSRASQDLQDPQDLLGKLDHKDLLDQLVHVVKLAQQGPQVRSTSFEI